jgi:hypothetical protein
VGPSDSRWREHHPARHGPISLPSESHYARAIERSLAASSPHAAGPAVPHLGLVYGQRGTSVITSNPAMRDHFKTGQMSRAQDLNLF